MKLLIVDDEAMVREWFSSAVAELGASYELVAAAGNAEEALSALRRHTVDVAVVDIRMPGMDGLELVRAIKHEWPRVAVVILSAYADFGFARRALTAGAENYLLKAEVTREQLKRMLDEISARNGPSPHRSHGDERPRPADQQPLVTLFDAEPVTAEAASEHGFVGAPLLVMLIGACDDRSETDERTFSDLLSRVTIEETFADVAGRFALHGRINRVTERVFLAICTVPGGETRGVSDLAVILADRLLSRVTAGSGARDSGVTYRIGADSRFSDLQGLRQQLWGAAVSLFESLLVGDEVAVASSNLGSSGRRLRRAYASLVGHLDRVEFSGARSAVRHVQREWEGAPVRERASVLLDIAARLVADGGNTALRGAYAWEYISDLGDALHGEEMVSMLLNRLIDAEHWAVITEQSNAAGLKKPVNRAIAYVKERFHTGIHLQEVAEVVGLSPAYLSERFHEVAGEHFSEMVSRLRIEKAKEILSRSSFPVRRVGELVGYANPSYFTQIFQRHTGVTPGRYREINESTSNLK